MVDRLGFRRYQFWVIGRIDQLDPDLVFGCSTIRHRMSGQTAPMKST
jgi:hypothetical protein